MTNNLSASHLISRLPYCLLGKIIIHSTFCSQCVYRYEVWRSDNQYL